ncbi:MAG: peptide chain release factor 2 [Brevinematales bacterium]|nr:peptide chain release factor 2 [Brevinematales bacterium]
MGALLERFEELEKELITDWNYLKIDEKLKQVNLLKEELNKESVWSDHQKFAKISSEISSLEKEVKNWVELREKISGNKEIVSLAEDENDEETLSHLSEEYNQLSKQLKDLEFVLMFSGEFDKNNAFLNIHPGAGGTESMDWADMLLRMYIRWAERHNFKVEILDYQPGEVAGVKDVTVYIKGEYAYGYLSSENGIHRLVRHSPFNANDKRQTSFCSVTVIPEINEDINIEIDPKDLRIDTYRAGGAGGQYVNKTESAVRITHIPTGVVVACQSERSQLQNRETAMKMLKAKLYDLEKRKKEEEKEKLTEKKAINFGSQIRSYVFQPYTLVKDHRTDYENRNIQAVMDGEIDDFIISFLKMKNSQQI